MGEASAPHEDERWAADRRGMVVGGVAPAAVAPLTMLMSDVGTDWWGAGAWLLPGGGDGALKFPRRLHLPQSIVFILCLANSCS